ncbi:hypothetical protein SESBI_33446 [Sesbania bispinosa]|nr:hypothetical protein SESBI_33446 [Sesbania bispinosa]
MAGFVRGFTGLIDGGDSSHAVATQPQSNPNLNSTFPLQAPPAAGFFNGENQKLFGVTNNTNIKLKGDGNGAFTLGNFK